MQRALVVVGVLLARALHAAAFDEHAQRVLLDSVGSWELVMDLDLAEDRDRHASALRRVRTLLRPSADLDWGELLHATVVGVFKAACNIQKDMLARHVASTVNLDCVVGNACSEPAPPSGWPGWLHDVFALVLDAAPPRAVNASRSYPHHSEQLSLLCVAAQLRLHTIALRLAERGASFACGDAHGLNVLHIVAANDDAELLALLWKLNANEALLSATTAKDEWGRTPAQLAQEAGKWSLLSRLERLVLESGLRSEALEASLGTCLDDGAGDAPQPRRKERPTGGWRGALKGTDEWSQGDNGQCDVSRVHASELDAARFLRDFVVPQKPVLILDGATHWGLDRVLQRDLLVREFGHVEGIGGTIPYAEVFGERDGVSSIREFVAFLDAKHAQLMRSPQQDVPARATESCPTPTNDRPDPPLYFFDDKVLESSSLSLHFTVPPLFPSVLKGDRVLQFYLGPQGSGAPYHFHCDAVNFLVYGAKKWWLRPPSRPLYTKVHPLEWCQQQPRDDSPTEVECVQSAGDVLYVPKLWTHAVLNLGESVGGAVEFNSELC